MALALILGAASLAVAAPAGALSCAPPDPIDWEDRFPRLDAALIVEIEAVREVTDGSLAGSLQISATVLELLEGQAGKRLEYTVSSLNPWGPYYEPGDEVAVIIEGGVTSDGRQNICGPWFEPDELRRAAERYGDLDPPPTTDPLPDRPPKPDEPAPLPQPVDPPEPDPLPPAPDPGSILDLLLGLLWMILRAFGLG